MYLLCLQLTYCMKTTKVRTGDPISNLFTFLTLQQILKIYRKTLEYPVVVMKL